MAKSDEEKVKKGAAGMAKATAGRSRKFKNRKKEADKMAARKNKGRKRNDPNTD